MNENCHFGGGQWPGRKHCVNSGTDDKKLSWGVVLGIEKKRQKHIPEISHRSWVSLSACCPVWLLISHQSKISAPPRTPSFSFVLLSSQPLKSPDYFGQSSLWDHCLTHSLLLLASLEFDLYGQKVSSCSSGKRLLNFLTCILRKQRWPLDLLCVFGCLTTLYSTFRILTAP